MRGKWGKRELEGETAREYWMSWETTKVSVSLHEVSEEKEVMKWLIGE